MEVKAITILKGNLALVKLGMFLEIGRDIDGYRERERERWIDRYVYRGRNRDISKKCSKSSKRTNTSGIYL